MFVNTAIFPTWPLVFLLILTETLVKCPFIQLSFSNSFFFGAEICKVEIFKHLLLAKRSTCEILKNFLFAKMSTGEIRSFLALENKHTRKVQTLIAVTLHAGNETETAKNGLTIFQWLWIGVQNFSPSYTYVNIVSFSKYYLDLFLYEKILRHLWVEWRYWLFVN